MPRTRPTPGATDLLAAFAAGLRYDDLPAAVALQARQSILDILGVALAGAGRGEGCDAILAYAAAAGGSGNARVWATGQRLPAAQAALVNAAHARALDYDDIIEFPQVHVAACVVPAALAIAQGTGAAIDGKHLLTAVAAGCEIQARLTAAIAPYAGQGLPVMLASQIFGYFGAAAACGRLLDLDHAAMRSAFGLAQMQAAGTEEMVVHAAESVGKCLYAGFSNQGGVQSALMAACGVKAAGEPLTGTAGLFNAYFAGGFASEALTDGLGTTFMSLQRCFKAMPGTLASHAFAEAALRLTEAEAITPDHIGKIVLHVGPWGKAMCEPHALRRRPPSASAAMNSIPFIVATAVTRGRVSVGDFGAAGRHDEHVLALAARIEHLVDPALGNLRGLEPGVVRIACRDGREHLLRVDAPLGHPSRPLSFDDVAAKFRENARHAPQPLDPARIESATGQVRDLEALHGIDALLGLLVP